MGVNQPAASEKLNEMYRAEHNPSDVYPSMGAGIDLTAGSASAWTQGAITEIIPADTIITNKLRIVATAIDTAGSNTPAEFELKY